LLAPIRQQQSRAQFAGSSIPSRYQVISSTSAPLTNIALGRKATLSRV
jgi:hypothetical protein